MKRCCVILFCVVAFAGCKGTHTLVTSSNRVHPSLSRKGNHIWVKPGTGKTHIDIGRDRE